MPSGRTLTSVSTLTNFNIPYKKTIGHKFRDLIATCGHYLKPVKKYIFPNFITVHYAYVIFMTILCSILMYPCHNARYIDILFISCGAVTQGGLNTIDVNNLTLYQQIIIYIICQLCTPIAIHGCLAFVRLYWFERYFDDIKNTSKRNFKMRRTRTILHREMTRRRTLTSRTHSRQQSEYSIPASTSGHGHGHPIYRSNTADTNFQEKLFSGLKVNRDEQSIISGRSDIQSQSQSSLRSSHIATDMFGRSKNNSNSNSNLSHSSSKDSNESIVNIVSSDKDNDNIPKTKGPLPLAQRGERFAKRRKSEDVRPEDMYRSIMMLREQQEHHQEDDQDTSEDVTDEDEPPLVISGRNVQQPSPKKKGHFKTQLTDVSSFEADIGSPELNASELYSDVDQYGASDDTESGDSYISRSSADDGNNFAVDDSTGNEYTDMDDSDNDSTNIDSPIHSSNLIRNDIRRDASGSLSSASRSNESSASSASSASSSTNTSSRPSGSSGAAQSDYFEGSNNSENSSGSQMASRNPSQHITFANNTRDRITNSPDSNKLSSPNKEGQSIQFNITAPPKKMIKRSSHDSQFAKPVRPSYQKARSSSRSILKHLKKGKKLRQNIKRRLSNNNVINAYTDNIPRQNSSHKVRSQEDQSDNQDPEEYFADNETDDDLMYDVSPRKLNELSQTPGFQKMVYKNWKANHGRKNKGKYKRRRRSWIFDNEFPHNKAYNPSEHKREHNPHLATSKNNPDETISTGYLSGGISTESENSSDFNYNFRTRHDYDEEDQNDPGYYGLNMDYNVSNTMNLPLSRTMSTNYLSWEPTIGRNSTFVGLTKSQRDELGGVEYRAIKLLCRILVMYYVGFHIMAFVMMVPWICKMNDYIHILRGDGVSPAWWGFFTAMSAFNDLGITLTPDSMNSFNEAIYPLIVMIWFIIIGNTGFPIFLRVIIWIAFHLAPDLSQMKESLGFLLDHPRRCFTLLFPSSATWWLLLTLLFLNITDLILFIILDFGSKILKPFSRGIRVLIGLFQAVSTRTAGFSVIDLSKLHAAIQVSYMLMMYVSVLPLAISIRRTNVYEEQSLGLYGKMNGDESEEEENDSQDAATEDSSVSDSTDDTRRRNRRDRNRRDRNKNRYSNRERQRSSSSDLDNPDQLSTKSFIGAHLRKQLSFDLWFLFLGLFIICICENDKIKDETRPNFSIFSILFEIVSAYGTVGLSLGYPNTNQSFSAQFTTLSKLIIIGMLIRGRCRGLPYSLDRAILLPSERLEHIDHIEDLKLRRNRAETMNNVDPMTDYVRTTTGWLRSNLERINRVSTMRSDRGDTQPIMEEYEMEEPHNSTRARS